MAVYKEPKTNTWRAVYRYKDWTGETRQTQKRGFATRRDALTWEREQMLYEQADLDMTFASFVDTYTVDMKNRIKENTWQTKEHIIRTKILPYFSKRKIKDIQPKDIIAWQNEMIKGNDKNGKKYSPVYLKTLHNQLSAIFNHAVKFYGLKENPAAKVGNMGKARSREMLFWTEEDYQKFAFAIMDKPLSYYAFEMLYWCGIREGELLALTPADLDFERGTVTINKSYQRIDGRDVVTEPKTPKSNRVIKMPDFLVEEMKEYKHITQEKKESTLQKALDAAHKLIAELKNTVADLTRKLAAVTKELSEYKSVRGKLRTADLEQENDRLRSRLRTYEDVISRNNLWSYFSRHRGKTPTKDDAR